MTSQNRKWTNPISKVLIVILIVIVCLAILQWFIIKELFSFGTTMVKDSLIKQAPEDVERAYIHQTFERVKNAGQQLPLSFLTGKISLRKIKEAGRYAMEANADEFWDAEEINTLLRMMNASVGFKRATEERDVDATHTPL